MAQDKKPTLEIVGPGKDYGEIPDHGELKINVREIDRQVRLERIWFLIRIGIVLAVMCLFTSIFAAILFSVIQ